MGSSRNKALYKCLTALLYCTLQHPGVVAVFTRRYVRVLAVVCCLSVCPSVVCTRYLKSVAEIQVCRSSVVNKQSYSMIHHVTFGYLIS